MKKITRKSRSKEAATNWYKQYRKYNDFENTDKGRIYTELVNLGKNPNPDDVDRIIGNSSWTNCRCSECNKYVEEVIQVGEEPDYESHTAYLCLECIEKAYNLSLLLL
jgi:hypothetical protein